MLIDGFRIGIELHHLHLRVTYLQHSFVRLSTETLCDRKDTVCQFPKRKTGSDGTYSQLFCKLHALLYMDHQFTLELSPLLFY